MHNKTTSAAQCPVLHGTNATVDSGHAQFWPKTLNLDPS